MLVLRRDDADGVQTCKTATVKKIQKKRKKIDGIKKNNNKYNEEGRKEKMKKSDMDGGGLMLSSC